MFTKDVAPYTGINAYEKITGAKRRDVFMLHYCQLFANYGDNVEFQLRKKLIVPDKKNFSRLYEQDAVPQIRYKAGSRPVLEKIVSEITAGTVSGQEKMLCLMRFCRGLYQKNPYPPKPGTYLFGGTEEELIEKGEFLCECLGRLMTALCEIAGLPGRIVGHILGGHFTAEIYTGEKWMYVDPRMGIYFLDSDGRGLSVMDLMDDPSMIRKQPENVRSEVAAYDTWEYRAWCSEHKFFHPLELNGFAYYSLADAAEYSYEQRPRADAVEAGLFKYNRPYGELARKVLTLAEEGDRLSWDAEPAVSLPLAFRNDGYSQYYGIEPPISRAVLEKTEIDCFADSNVKTLIWGLGPGSVACFGSKVLEPIGTGLSKAALKRVRAQDLWAVENVRDLIAAGTDPLQIAAERGHKLGLKVIARLEMNHEYIAPPDPPKAEWQNQYIWDFFVGKFNKEHPEFRIGIHDSTANLDYKYPEVRQLKLEIFKEALEFGMNGVIMDFCVYLPYFKEPDVKIMTQFMRDMRKMVNSFSPKREIIVRVPWQGALEEGLDWQSWMKEGLIDEIEPAFRWKRIKKLDADGKSIIKMQQYQDFDVPVSEFISLGNRTGVKVNGCMFFALNLGVTLDPRPGDKEKGIIRYNKAKTKEMFNAQALVLYRDGVAGLTLDNPTARKFWMGRPWYNDLGDFNKVLFADKHYVANRVNCRIEEPPVQAWSPVTESFSMRIGDDFAAADKAGLTPDATLIFNLRPMGDDEDFFVELNGTRIAELTAEHDRTDAPPDVYNTKDDGWELVTRKDWFRLGERRLRLSADTLLTGENKIDLIYRTGHSNEFQKIIVPWMELSINYAPKEKA